MTPPFHETIPCHEKFLSRSHEKMRASQRAVSIQQLLKAVNCTLISG